MKRNLRNCLVTLTARFGVHSRISDGWPNMHGRMCPFEGSISFLGCGRPLREDVIDECGHGSRFDGASPPGSATSRIGLEKPVAGSDSDHSIGRNLPGLASLALKSRNRKSANKAGNKFRETGKTRISCSCPFARRDRLPPPDQDFRRRLADFHQRCKTGSRLSAGDRLAFGP